MIDFSEPVSLVDLIVSALTKAKPEADEHNVQLAWTVDPSLPPYISAKRVDLPSIVLVLIRRAMHVVRNSILHITIAGSGKDRVVIQLEDDGHSAWLDDKLWQQLVFWVEELGGEAKREDGGVYWAVILPLDETSVNVMQLQTQQAAPGALNVLLASADTDVRAKILDRIKAAGHHTLECRTQQDSIRMCQQHLFDLVLLDSDLPGGGGLALAKALRVCAPDQRLIGLISTGIPQDHSDFDWVKLWMHKPPRDAEVKLALEVAMSQRREQTEEAKAAREARRSVGV
jgi:CheY-like chemotaxis protein